MGVTVRSEAGAQPALSPASEPREATASLRRFPYPYRAMLAISSDIDHTRIDTLRETHRFMNTRERTSMGEGVGLDIANSMWVYKTPIADPARDDLSYFHGLSWDTPSVFGDELLCYARAGWIDTLHSYGNFGFTRRVDVRFERAHAEHGLTMLQRHGIKLTVWVNHGDRNNRQNIGDSEWTCGDLPEAPEYHTDLLRAYGTEFLWLHGRTDVIGRDSALEEYDLRDGGKMFGFRRFQSLRNYPDAQRLGHAFGLNCFTAHGGDRLLQVWTPQGLKYQLSDEVLNSLVENGRVCVIGQHLGSINPMIAFDGEMVAAFKRLRKFQDDGMILVARTSRLLHYNRVHDHLQYSVAENDGRLVIDIVAVEDPVRGHWLPTIEDVRGITFEIADAHPIELRIIGKKVDPAETVTANVESGRRIAGVRWFSPNLIDHSTEFLATGKSSYLLWSQPARELADRENAQIIACLRADRENVPEGVSAERYNIAIDYAIERYQIGLRRYGSLLERIGFSELQRGLDVGSGAGHWAIAFARHGGSVLGIDLHTEHVEIANRTAKWLGLNDRVRFRIGNAEVMALPADNFDCAWSHSVLMFTDIEMSVKALALGLTGSGVFYCGYTGEGDRLHDVQSSFTNDGGETLAHKLLVLLNCYLRRLGLFNAFYRVRILTLEDLLRVCRMFGFEYVGQPGVQDGRRDYLGIPATFDFLVRKTRDTGRARSLLLEGKAVEEDWLDDLDQIARSGCPGLVCDVFAAVDPDPADERQREVYARALIRAGRAATPAGQAMFANPRPLPCHVMGLYQHDRRDIAAALTHYQKMDASHPDKAFLVGSCLLAGKQFDDARRHFGDALDAGWRQPREWIGLVAAHHGAGDHDGALAAFRGFVESRREAGVTESVIAPELARLDRAR
jgi:SAM-dependent methyltransferase